MGLDITVYKPIKVKEEDFQKIEDFLNIEDHPELSVFLFTSSILFIFVFQFKKKLHISVAVRFN